MSMHFAPQWLKQPIKPSGGTATAPAPASSKPSATQAPAPANPFPALGPRPASPYNSISYSHITHPTSSSPPPASPLEASANGGAHPFRYSRQEILSLFDASKFSAPPIELSHLASSQAVIYSENAVNPIGLRDVNEVEKRLLGTSVNPRLLRPAPASGAKGFGKGEGGAFAKETALPALNTAPVGSPVQQQGHRRVPGSIGEKIETPVRSAANNWRPSRTLSTTGSLASPGAGAGFDGVLGFGSIAPGPPTPTAASAANGINGLNSEVDAGPGWGSGNRRWRSAAATAQERSSQSTIATPSATPLPERDATVATPAPAPPQPQQEARDQPQQPAEADPASIIWYYRDPSGNQQGPFAATQMHDWYLLSYFAEDLPLRRDSETEYHTLRDLKTATGNPTAPFLAKLLPKAPPPMLPPNLPIPGYNLPQPPPAQPWGGFAPPQQNLVAPFDNLAIQHPFAPYPQHMAPQPIYSPVIGGPVQRTNGFYSPAVGVPLADAHSPWGVPQQQQQQLPHQPQWQAPVPQQQQQPSYFPQAPAAPSPYTEQPITRETSAPAAEPIREPVRESSPVKKSEPVPEPEVETEAPQENAASTAEPSPVPAPAAPAASPWAKVAPVQSTPIQAAAEPAQSSPSSPVPAAAAPSSTSLPPAHASLPAKPATRQSVSVAPAAVAATAENSPVTTPAKATPAKAPWAAAKEEEKGRASPVGPSLREIQEAEAKEAKEANARKAAERAAAGSPAPAAESSDIPQQMSWGLPSQGNKGAASPSVAPAAGPVWGGGDAAAPKKTLKQIQEEEEKRKARVAAQAKAAASANGTAAASGKRGYADLAAAPTASAAAGAGGAWSTVGAGGKPAATPAKPAVAPVKPVVAAARPVVSSISKKAAVDEQPSVEFIRWTKQALVGLSGVNVDEFIQMLLSFPIEPGAQRSETLEIIADSVYANSSTLDGRRFAQEFYTKRKADAQARTSASVKISSLADVVKTQPKPAPTSDFGFKVVKAKGKGRK